MGSEIVCALTKRPYSRLWSSFDWNEYLLRCSLSLRDKEISHINTSDILTYTVVMDYVLYKVVWSDISIHLEMYL